MFHGAAIPGPVKFNVCSVPITSHGMHEPPVWGSRQPADTLQTSAGSYDCPFHCSTVTSFGGSLDQCRATERTRTGGGVVKLEKLSATLLAPMADCQNVLWFPSSSALAECSTPPMQSSGATSKPSMYSGAELQVELALTLNRAAQLRSTRHAKAARSEALMFCIKIIKSRPTRNDQLNFLDQQLVRMRNTTGRDFSSLVT